MHIYKTAKTLNNWLALSLISVFSSRKNIGGQAVIEGVMMRSPECWAVAVRGHEGTIHTLKRPIKKLHPLLRLPVLRGTVMLIESLVLGIKALNFSASKAYPEEDTPGSLGMVIAVGTAFIAAVVIFIFLPLFITKAASTLWPSLTHNTVSFNLFEGMIRLLFFLLYLAAIGLWSEMRRVFEYHGAEHKVIHAYEKGLSMERPEDVITFSPRHPRCGTSFLLIVMCCSILIFSFIPQQWSFIEKFLGRITLIPLVAGVSYELLKFSAKRQNNRLVKYIILPGLLLQALTTREPDTTQVEVALVALREVL